MSNTERFAAVGVLVAIAAAREFSGLGRFHSSSDVDIVLAL